MWPNALAKNKINVCFGRSLLASGLGAMSRSGKVRFSDAFSVASDVAQTAGFFA